MKKIVFITGASTGIGYSTACLLQKSGYQVYGCVRKQTDLKRIEAAAPGLKGVILDVTKPKQLMQILTDFGPEFDTASQFSLINNAGIAVAGPLEALPINDLRKQFETNVLGPAEVTQELLPWIRKTKGRVINISSIAGLSSAPFIGAYCASKYAIEALSDALRRELMPFGVKVVLIEPGPISTPLIDKGFANIDAVLASLRQDRLPLYRAALEKFIGFTSKAMKNAIPPERVAEAILKALTDKSPNIRMVVAAGPEKIAARVMQNAPARLYDFAIGKILS